MRPDAQKTTVSSVDGLFDQHLPGLYWSLCDRAPPQDGSLQCPSCKTIYGEKTGTQPKGKMEIYSIGQSLPGHPDCGTIQIIYSIPPGIQVGLHTAPPRFSQAQLPSVSLQWSFILHHNFSSSLWIITCVSTWLLFVSRTQRRLVFSSQL